MQPIKNISYNSYRLLIAFVVLVVLPYTMKSQPVVTIGDMAGCENTEVLMPVQIANMENVGAITLYIKVDTNIIDYVGVQDVNPAFSTGDFVGGENKGKQEIIITWISTVPAFIDSGLMCNIRVDFKNNSSNFDFLDKSEFVYSDLTLVEGVEYVNGSLMSLSAVSVDPVSQQLDTGDDATIQLVGSMDGITSIQWQKSDDENGWVDLTENNTYTGVAETKLTITAVTKAMNGNLFRCVLANDMCSRETIESKLLVGPQGLNNYKHRTVEPIEIFPNPAVDLLSCQLNRKLLNGELRLVNMNGVVLDRFKVSKLGMENLLTINIASIESGIYFVQLYDGRQMIAVARFVKN